MIETKRLLLREFMEMNWQPVATEDALGDLFSWSMAFRK